MFSEMAFYTSSGFKVSVFFDLRLKGIRYSFQSTSGIKWMIQKCFSLACWGNSVSPCYTFESSRASWALYEIFKLCVTKYSRENLSEKKIALNNSNMLQNPLNLSCSLTVGKQNRVFKGCQPPSKVLQDMLQEMANNSLPWKNIKSQPGDLRCLCYYWYLWFHIHAKGIFFTHSWNLIYVCYTYNKNNETKWICMRDRKREWVNNHILSHVVFKLKYTLEYI